VTDVLPRSFYARDTVKVARELLGKTLAHGALAGAIVETEAYHGLDDLASHGRKRTPRSEIMYGPAGVAYVYQIYGMWYCLNAVTGDEGFPAAVLIRAVHLPDDPRAAAGPGKLCRALGIDKRHNGGDLARGPIVVGDGPAPKKIRRGPRIGVDYAGAWADKPWRFWIDGDPAVSRP
jgi:DNA-3-methyladenine glycosylase